MPSGLLLIVRQIHSIRAVSEQIRARTTVFFLSSPEVSNGRSAEPGDWESQQHRSSLSVRTNEKMPSGGLAQSPARRRRRSTAV